MSDSEYFEAPTDSFWEINQYKRVVRRTEDGYKLCNDLMQMLSERANIEKLYSKSLKQWSKKWNEYIEKCPEYGTMKATWNSMTSESNSLSEIHLQIHDDIEEKLLIDVKAWQKQNYPKNMMNSLKVAKQFEEEFTKAQKPWAKKYTLVEKTKKEYHNQCKLLQTARVNESNSKNDATLSAEQKKKIEDKVEKLRKEAENAKHKYQQALDELNEYNSHYIEDMKNIYKKCDAFEKSRLDYFIQKFSQAHSFLDMTQKNQLNNIYGDFMNTIKSTNPDKDLLGWSKQHGAAMGMNWPAFEEYSEEFKNIAKSEKRAKVNDDNGITITAIKQKEDVLPEPSLRSSNLESNRESIKPVPPRRVDTLEYPSEQNPFTDLDEFSDEDNNVTNNNNHNNSKSISPSSSNNNNNSGLRSKIISTSKIAPTKPIITKQNDDNKENEYENIKSHIIYDILKNDFENFNSNINYDDEYNIYQNIPLNIDKLDEKASVQPLQKDTNPFGDSDDDVDTSTAPTSNHHLNDNRTNFNNNNHNHHNANHTEQYLNIKVRAIYDYQSAEEDELSFKAGDEFTKLANEDDRGWCLGKIGDKIGLYPATYAVEH